MNFLLSFNKTYQYNSCDDIIHLILEDLRFIFTILHWVYSLNIIFIVYFRAFASKNFETSVRKYIIMIINV